MLFKKIKLLKLYFILWLISTSFNFLYIFGDVGQLFYSVMIAIHPAVIMLTVLRGYNMDIHKFDKVDKEATLGAELSSITNE